MMGVTIGIWRAAIGLFHARSRTLRSHRLHLLKQRFFNNSRLTLFTCLTVTILIHSFLMCSGLHPNPGPDYGFSDIKLCHANVRSLKSRNSDGIMEKFEYIKNNLSSFDIITISETWLTTDYDSSLFLLSDFQEPFRKDREAGYGGVLAWISSNIACKRRLDFEVLN